MMDKQEDDSSGKASPGGGVKSLKSRYEALPTGVGVGGIRPPVGSKPNFKFKSPPSQENSPKPHIPPRIGTKPYIPRLSPGGATQPMVNVRELSGRKGSLKEVTNKRASAGREVEASAGAAAGNTDHNQNRTACKPQTAGKKPHIGAKPPLLNTKPKAKVITNGTVNATPSKLKPTVLNTSAQEGTDKDNQKSEDKPIDLPQSEPSQDSSSSKDTPVEPETIASSVIASPPSSPEVQVNGRAIEHDEAMHTKTLVTPVQPTDGSPTLPERHGIAKKEEILPKHPLPSEVIINSERYVLRKIPSLETLGSAPKKPCKLSHVKLPGLPLSKRPLPGLPPEPEVPERPPTRPPKGFRRPLPPAPATPSPPPSTKNASSTGTPEAVDEDFYDDIETGQSEASFDSNKNNVPSIEPMTDDELDKFDGEDEDIYDDIEGDDDIKPSPHKITPISKPLPPPAPSVPPRNNAPLAEEEDEEIYEVFGDSAIDGETRQDLEVSQRLGKEEVKRQKEEREKERLRKEHEHKEREEKRKREKEEKEKQRREQERAKKELKDQKEREKEQKRKEAEELRIKKQFKLTGSEFVINNGVVIDDSKGRGLNLDVKKGDKVEVLRIENNPAGKWLARNMDQKLGYVDANNIEVDTTSIRSSMETAYSTYVSAGIVCPIIPEDEEEYADVSIAIDDDNIYELGD